MNLEKDSKYRQSRCLLHVAIPSAALLLFSTFWPAPAHAASSEQSEALLERQFQETVHPFLKEHCYSCHGKQRPKGDFDLRPFTNAETVAQDELRWKLILDQLSTGQMPPEDEEQPPAELRHKVIDWIHRMRKHVGERNAGDPGIVLARRLNNAEYDYTIRDLTGVDIRPTREFPIDPANEVGFDNSGESLTMSPALVKKYLEAARTVADHLVLKPEGFSFAPHRVVADTDRDKYCVKRIIQFYQQQPTNYVDYFVAAWRYQNRAALGKPEATLNDFADQAKVSPKYLQTVWSALAETQDEFGPFAALRTLWQNMPGPEATEKTVQSAGEQLRDFVVQLRQKLVPTVENLKIRGVNPGSQPLVLWKDRQMAANRTAYRGGALQLDFASLNLTPEVSTVLSAPSDETKREQYEGAFKRFCAVFPDAFYVSERSRIFLAPGEEDKSNVGRLLSAGFHNQFGYFRDDGPLYSLVLDGQQQKELDDLWKELDFIASACIRQHKSFIWFEKAESSFMLGPDFEFARAEDNDSTSETKVKQLADVYLAKIRRSTTNEVVINAVIEHFDRMNASIRWVEQARLSAEASHLKSLQEFAERAYRRPLSKEEKEDIVAFYRDLRTKDSLPHEEAVRDTVVSILMAPDFCYRIDLPAGESDIQPLSAFSLASRLSYFLWSSMPDQELLDRVAAGDLRQPEILRAQVRRMLKDKKIQALATEFTGNWLDFRRFEDHNAVDRQRFTSFDNNLRQAMFEEPIRFFQDIASNNGSVLDFIFANHTFVNPTLARHYGMNHVTASSNEWVRVENANAFQRGGYLPMSVFLTKNSPGLRTSPVKRGYWVVRRLLGEHIPAPPPNVPELPSDESKLGDLTLRETLERHRQDKSCASCHARFDAMGLVFEGFGPIGERREKDLGDRPVDDRAVFPGGIEGAGVEGLRNYLREHRQDDFVDSLCRKLYAYALGRSLMLSDEPTLSSMRETLKANGYKFDSLIESIVTSPQFLNKRGRKDLTSN